MCLSNFTSPLQSIDTQVFFMTKYHLGILYILVKGRRCRDRMVFGFTATCAISALQQVCGFLQVLRFPPPIKLTATIYPGN